MARISLGLCLMLVVASSVIYEAQGHFLLKNYLKTQFPSKGNEFTPYVNRGLTELLTDLERFCPPTPEFKGFFTEFKSYMSFIETSSSSSSKNIDMEMTKKADGLFRAMSAISGGAGQKSAEAGSFKSTMISMGKTLVEQKRSTTTITSTEKKTLVTSMVQWTKTIATVVKTASEKKGKKIDINSFGLDVDVKSIVSVSGSSHSSSSSTKTSSESSSKSSSYNARAETGSSAKAKETTEKGEKKDNAEKKPERKEEKKPEKKEEKKPEKKEEKDSSSAKTKETSSTKAGASGSTKTGSSFKDTTGGSAGSPRGSPTAAKDKTSGSPTSDKGRTSEKESGNAGSVKQQSNNAASRGSASSMNQQQSKKSESASSTTSVTEIEKETSQETSSFISGLEKRFSQKAELRPFFEKLKASMTASSRVSSTKSAQEFTSTAKSTTGKLSDAMTFVGSRFSKSAEMKSNIETTQEKLMKSLKEFQDLNSRIVGEQKVSTTKETQIKQTMSKIEQVTTQFVETAASSSSQQSQQSQKQRTATSQQQTAASSQQQTAASSQQQNEQQNGMGRLKTN